ncbi:hypothetical protein V5N11_009782 [Cardamine amara subsp. amara]|uniref:GRF-type domain-containing protein n=1 Tax=Cardamine amara subsp. amara TaxID=228776 RepID=A0ABD1B9U4_CARAN
MSSKSEDSSVNTFGIRGFPAKCVCGLESTIYTSNTKKNPGRPFFRCPTKRDDHLFKWVEEAVLEEVEDAIPKIRCIESEFYHAKAEAEAMKAAIRELKAEVMITKVEVRRFKLILKLCLGIICLIMLVCLVMIMFGKAKAKRNVISY